VNRGLACAITATINARRRWRTGFGVLYLSALIACVKPAGADLGRLSGSAA
jgi:hypothetical protein